MTQINLHRQGLIFLFKQLAVGLFNNTGNNFCNIDGSSGEDEQVLQLSVGLELEHQPFAQEVVVESQVADLDVRLKGGREHLDGDLVTLGTVQL
jgi:hypothetical protein